MSMQQIYVLHYLTLECMLSLHTIANFKFVCMYIHLIYSCCDQTNPVDSQSLCKKNQLH